MKVLEMLLFGYNRGCILVGGDKLYRRNYRGFLN